MAATINIITNPKSSDNSWAMAFAANLGQYLKKYAGKDVKVDWVDPDAAQPNGVYIAVVDEAFVENPGIADKLESTFKGTTSGSLFLVFPDKLSNEPLSELDGKRFDFFVYNALDQGYDSIKEPKGEKDEAYYWAKLFDLAKAIVQQFESKADDTDYIFVAETSEDQKQNRDSIIRDLAQYGFRVLPSSPLPTDPDQLKAKVKELLAKCKYAIHVFGAAEANMDHLLIQNDEASAASRDRKGSGNDLKRFIWISTALKLSTDQRVRLESLKANSLGLSGADLIQTPLEVLKTVVHNELLNRSGNKHQKGAYEGAVYIINEEKHGSEAAKIESVLSASGIKTVSSAFDDHDLALFVRHKSILKECAACLIYYPDENRMWIKSKVDDIIKSPGYGRERDFSGICLIGEKDETNLAERYNNYLYIEKDKALDKSSLGEFIESINSNGTRN